MANTYGGIILLGVDEVKTEKDWKKHYLITGLADAEKLRVDFWNLLNDSEKVNINLLKSCRLRVKVLLRFMFHRLIITKSRCASPAT